jgi:DNA-binding protein H-NS
MTKTYAQIQKQIDALTQEAERVKRKEVDGVIARIKEAIAVYGLTAGDLGLAGTRMSKAVRGKKAGKKAGAKSKSAAAIKFRDDAGNTWVGRGPRPQWLRDALAGGKKLVDFAVGSSDAMPNGAATPAAKTVGAEKSAAKKATVKKAPAKKKASKAKFSDGAGNRWSGFGPKPGWLKNAIAAGKKLEDFAV